LLEFGKFHRSTLGQSLGYGLALEWTPDRRSAHVKTLGNVTATSEQLTVIDNPAPGFWLIRGAAGSGKTTTALLRLKFLVRYWRERRADLGLQAPVRMLVLTFNALYGAISPSSQSSRGL
jgi:hypothetical protein